MSEKIRCGWVSSDPLYIEYHDREWGVPEHDDHRLFEMLTLEGAQAGLSWITVLRKREAYQELFEGFDPRRVAKIEPGRVEEILTNPGIIRNRLKVESTVTNAQAFLKVQEEFGTFDAYLWGFVGGAPKVNSWKTLAEVPASTGDSDVLSKDLKKRGFRFVGTTICYAYMQAVGLVNDHTTDCFRYPR